MIRWFRDITLDDLPLVGGKNASLGELHRELSAAGVRVPDGFAVTAEAYRAIVEAGDLRDRMTALLQGIDGRDVARLATSGAALRSLVENAPWPADLEQLVRNAYAALGEGAAGGVSVAVRSSATAEDLPEASFAGQQETFLGVRGADALIRACRRCFASLFTDRAISYRADKGFDEVPIALSIGVQRMVRSDLGSSGVMFTLDTETGFRDVVLINASFGLGETVVQGSVTPDEYCVFKPPLQQDLKPIIQKTVGSKEFKLVYDEGGSRAVKTVPVAAADRARYALTDDEILTLARWARL